jgi:site-specific recombinase XerD
MATLIKNKTGIYYIVYSSCGKRIWRTLGTRDRNLAYSRFIERERIGIEPEKYVAPPAAHQPITLQHAATDYFLYIKTNFSINTQSNYRSIIRQIITYFGPERPLNNITTQEIERFKCNKYEKKISPHTVNYTLRCIKAFFNLMVSWGILEKSPSKGVKSIRIDETIRPYLSREDLQTVLTYTHGTQLHDIILFAVLTGLRLGEIVNLTWDDISLNKRKIIVRSNGNFRTKSGKMRVIPISSALLKLLEATQEKTGLLFRSPQGNAWRGQFISKQFKQAVRNCGLNEKLHFHSLRHTFGSYLVESGVSLFHVQQLMGHSSPYVTQIYAHLGTAELLSSVEKIDLTTSDI